MAVIVVTRYKGHGDHTAFAKEAAAILKRHGALSVRAGRGIAGDCAGEVVAATAFTDWEAFGRAMQALATDPDWRRMQSEAAKTFELRDRSIIAGEEF
jgi:uncharacterized protein DUF6854